jgi:hypothetical protein
LKFPIFLRISANFSGYPGGGGIGVGPPGGAGRGARTVPRPGAVNRPAKRCLLTVCLPNLCHLDGNACLLPPGIEARKQEQTTMDPTVPNKHRPLMHVHSMLDASKNSDSLEEV